MVVAVLLALSSCVLDNDAPVKPIGEELPVKFSIRLPESQTSRGTETRAITGAEENTIFTVDVLAFVADGSSFKYAYKASYVDKAINGNEMVVTVTAKGYSVQQQFIVLVNASEELAGAGIILNEELSSAMRKIISTTGGGEWPARNTAGGEFAPIPMYAKTTPQIINADNTSIGNYPLIRMVAKINVRLHTDVDNFKLANASLFNYSDCGYVAYDFSDFVVDRVTKAGIPDRNHSGVPVVEPTVFYEAVYGLDERGMIVNSIYTFEAEKITGNEDRIKKAALVIGGYYSTNTNDLVYYRVDIKTTDDMTSNISTGIWRNHEYTVIVQSVAGPGYDTALDAYLGAKKIDFAVEVTPWGQSVDVPLPWGEMQPSANSYIVPTGKTIIFPVFGQVQQAMDAGDLPGNWITNDMNLVPEIHYAYKSADADEIVDASKMTLHKGYTKETTVMTVTAKNMAGNVLVAVFDDVNGNGVRDEDEEIKWSWHIWVCDGDDLPREHGTSRWMDRYLGATDTKWNDFANEEIDGDPVAGLYYFWGRKDPIAWPDMKIRFPDASEDILKYSIKNPLTYFLQWDDYVGGEAWGHLGGKTVYDPCPYGWRVSPSEMLTSGMNDLSYRSDVESTWMIYMYDDIPFPLLKRDPSLLSHSYRTYICSNDLSLWSVLQFDMDNKMFDNSLVGVVRPAFATGVVRCTKDASTATYTPKLEAVAEQDFCVATGTDYEITVKSNTKWSASVKNGTNKVVSGDRSAIGKPLITRLNGGSAAGYARGGAENTDTEIIITITSADYCTNYKEIEGDLTIVFRDEISGRVMDEVTVTMLSGVLREVSNSYIVEAGGPPIVIPVSRANESALGIQIAAGARFEGMKTWANDGTVGRNSGKPELITAGKGPGAHIYVEIGETKGNALVSASFVTRTVGGTVTNEEIQWSWHLWVCDPNDMPGESGSSGWMDRYLGAMAENWVDINNTSSRDPVFGLPFQWGRKSPLPENGGAYYLGGPITMETAVRNPHYLMRRWEVPAELNDAWGVSGPKMIYDPCPKGWRVASPEQYLRLDLTIDEPYRRSAIGNEGRFAFIGDFPLVFSNYTFVRLWTNRITTDAVVKHRYVIEVSLNDPEYNFGDHAYVRCTKDN